MNKVIAIAFTAALSVAAFSEAHYGQRVWVDVNANGKLATLEGPPGDRPNPGNTNPYLPSEFTPSRIFTRDMGGLGDITPGVNDSTSDSDGLNYSTKFPGYEATKFPTTAFAVSINLDIVGQPKFFDTASGTFVPVSQKFSGSPLPYFTAGDASGFGTSPTDNSIVPATLAFSVGTHHHVSYDLIYPNPGNGNDGYDGVYALGLRLSGGGYTASDTFYLVLGKNASLQTLQLADSVANATLVPEPAAIGVIAAVVGLLGGRRRRA